MDDAPYTPIEVAVALALYGYNVSPFTRAMAIVNHFNGECAELEDLIAAVTRYGTAATELAFPSAVVYVDQALARYGSEARSRCAIERGGFRG